MSYLFLFTATIGEITLSLDTHKPSDIAAISITTIAMVVSVIGNSLVLIVHFVNMSSITKTKIVIILLALADMICSILSFLISAHYTIFYDGKFVKLVTLQLGVVHKSRRGGVKKGVH